MTRAAGEESALVNERGALASGKDLRASALPQVQEAQLTLLIWCSV
jgi:hypothetical protein